MVYYVLLQNVLIEILLINKTGRSLSNHKAPRLFSEMAIKCKK